MKTIYKITLLGLLALSLHTYATEPTGSVSIAPVTTSSASNNIGTTSAEAGTSSNAQNINFNSSPGPSTTTIRTTGNANLGGFSGSFSSDYCGATAQAGLGGIGFGVSGGMPKIDNACVMLRTFERTQQAASALSAIDPIGSEKLRRASLAILAEIDPKVKTIFEKAGLINQDGVALVGSRTLNPEAKTTANNVQADENNKKTSVNSTQSNNNDLPWFESKTNDIEKIQVLDNTTKDKKNSKWFGIF